jgi:hypothetical protein
MVRYHTLLARTKIIIRLPMPAAPVSESQPIGGLPLRPELFDLRPALNEDSSLNCRP